MPTVKCTKCQRPQDWPVTNDDRKKLRVPGGYIELSCQHDDCREDLAIGSCRKCKDKTAKLHAASKCRFHKDLFYCPKCAINAPVERSNPTEASATLQQTDHVQEPAAEIKPPVKEPTGENLESDLVFQDAESAYPRDTAQVIQDSATLAQLSRIEEALASITQRLDALPNQNNQSVTNEDIEGRINEVTKTLRNIDTRLEKLEVTTKQDIRSRLDEVSNSVQNTLSNSVNKLNNSLSQLLENPILDQKLMPSLDGDGSSVKVPNESPWEPVAQLVVDLLNSSSMTKTLNEIIPALNKVESVDKRFRKYVASTLKDIRCDMLGQLGGDGSRFEWHSIPKGINGELRRLEGQLSQKLIEEVKELSGGSRLKSSPGRRTESDAKQQAESSVPDNLAAILCEALAFHPRELKKAREAFESGTASRLVKDLPNLFNFLEDERDHWTDLASKSPRGAKHAPDADDFKDVNREVARVLQKFDQKFHSWQTSNHICRVPKSDSSEFDHRYHFPVITELTDDRSKHRHIKNVAHYGYVFNDGKHEIILQKAEVIVWNCPDD
jgi:hypothetical protein